MGTGITCLDYPWGCLAHGSHELGGQSGLGCWCNRVGPLQGVGSVGGAKSERAMAFDAARAGGKADGDMVKERIQN